MRVDRRFGDARCCFRKGLFMCVAAEFRLTDNGKLEVIFSSPDKNLSCPAVYTFSFMKDKKYSRFYIGETKCFVSRMNDYRRGNDSASTDFSVHIAIKWFLENGCKIEVKGDCSYGGAQKDELKSALLKAEKKQIKEAASSGKWLLNYLPSYNYKETDGAVIHKASVEGFCKYLKAQP